METVLYSPLLLFMLTVIAGAGTWAAVRIFEIISQRNALNSKEIKLLIEQNQKLLYQNEELSQRIENLETIITSLDNEVLDTAMRIKGIQNPTTQRSIEEMTNRINGKAKDSIERNLSNVMNKVLKKIDTYLEEPKS